MADSSYQHLLLALDFNADETVLIDRALELRERLGARLSLVHIIDPVPPGVDYAGGAFVAEPLIPDTVELDEALMDAARDRLYELGGRLEVPKDDCLLEIGATAEGIARTAREQGADLILIGAHEHHHWLGRLFGSTSKAVLGHQGCDILVVRIAVGS